MAAASSSSSTNPKEPVNLASFHPGTVEAIAKGTDISRFKDPSPNRVVAASPKFAVYTLKDQSKLRVVAAAAGQSSAASMSLEKHTAPVKQIAFMPGRTNIVASASENELLVWVIVDGTGPVVSLIFNANKVAGFCWTQPDNQSNPSNLAIVTKDTNELLTVASGALFQANMQDESGTLKNAPQKEVTIDRAASCVVAAKGIKPDLASTFPIVAEAHPALIAAADATTAVVVKNGSATRWNPVAESRAKNDVPEKIVSIAVSHLPRPNTVVIATTSTVTFWDLSLDAPSKLLDIDVPLRVLGAAAAATRIVLAVTGETGDEVKNIQLASVGINTRKGGNANQLHVAGMTLYDVVLDVAFATTACSVFTLSEKAEDPSCLLDTGKTLSVYTLPKIIRPRAQKQQHQDPTSPVAATNGENGASLSIPAPHSSHNVHLPAYGGSGGAQQQQALSPALAQLAALTGIIPTSSNSRAPLFAVSGDGSADFDKQLEPLGQRLNANASRVRSKASDFSSILPNDHETLLAQALDSQRESIAATVRNAVAKELEARAGAKSSAAPPSQSGGAVSIDEETSAQISETVVRGVSDGIVENIARGISDALNIQLARRVDGLVQSAVQKYVKRLKKQQEKEGNKSAEGVAQEVLSAARGELESKQKEYGMQLLLQLQQLNRPATEALQRLQKVIAQQQSFIDKFTNSGLVEEVERLRAEVANIRTSAAGTSVAAPSKESILKRARDAFAAGNVENGLQWVLQQNDSNMTLALLTGVDADKLEDLIESTKDDVPIARWERCATDLAQIVDPEHLRSTLQILLAIVSGTTVAKNTRVAEVLKGYTDTWKRSPGQLPSDVRDSLRDLSLAIRN